MILHRAWHGADLCLPLAIYELTLPEETTWAFIGWEQNALPRETSRVLA